MNPITKMYSALSTMVGYLAHQMRPEHTGKHATGRRKPHNWRKNRKIRKLIAARSQKINRNK